MLCLPETPWIDGHWRQVAGSMMAFMHHDMTGKVWAHLILAHHGLVAFIPDLYSPVLIPLCITKQNTLFRQSGMPPTTISS